MSEEILKALMKLFAIIAKQDTENRSNKNEYVEVFLHSQIKSENVQEYLNLYQEFLHEDDAKDKENGESEKKKLVSVKDSVRTLAICKKINKTLTQKQKVVVLIRLLELLKKDNSFTEQHMDLLNTASDVFKISSNEYKLIEAFVREDETSKLDPLSCLIISDKIPEFETEIDSKKFIISEGLDRDLSIIFVESVNLYFLRYNGNSEVSLNGLNLNKSNVYLFAQGSTIRLPRGTVFYSDVVSRFMQTNAEEAISFNAKITEHKFPNGTIALRNVEVSEKSGTLVGLMGASGAGKTTLLNILSGLEKPSNGQIFVNGINLNEQYDSIKGIIGYIPQDDLLIEELSVFQNLYYNAKLCFKDLTETELTERVDKTLSDLGLFTIKDVVVGNVLDKKISGGQRKRLNIALELIREPAILFVDEPTSGLSSRDSENVMDLLKELSLRGRLIFVVIHQPSSDIYKMFDKLLLLDTGGYPIYYGNPIEAVIYFKKETNQINSESGECHTCGNVNPELLFNIIESKVVDEYGNYLPERKISPKKWNETYQQKVKIKKAEDIDQPISNKLQLPTKFSQLKVFLTRDLLSKLKNNQYLIINLLEAPVLAFILSFIIRYIDHSNSKEYDFMYNENIPAYLFMSIVVALFIGLTVSAEEIFKDLKILKRESFLNLSRRSYLFSKIILLFTLSAIQTLLFVLIGNTIVGIQGMFFEYWITMFSVACFANVLGLNISASFNSAVTIYILIPLFIIPQMILGGAMFSFDKLNENVGGGNKVPLIADVMASRWAYEAMMVNQYSNNLYQKHIYGFEKDLSKANYKMVYFLPKLTEIADGLFEEVQKNDKINATNDLMLLKNELSFEFKSFKLNNELEFLNNLSISNYTEENNETLKGYITDLNNLYSDKFSVAEKEKQTFLAQFTEDENMLKKFEKVKRSYFNENVSDIVTASTNKSKIIREENKLIQVIDPIYNDPTPSGALDYRTHFYAPKKQFLGKTFSTFSFNIMVIWIMSIFLFITLYFESFKKLIGIGAKLNFKRK